MFRRPCERFFAAVAAKLAAVIPLIGEERWSTQPTNHDHPLQKIVRRQPVQSLAATMVSREKNRVSSSPRDW